MLRKMVFFILITSQNIYAPLKHLNLCVHYKDVKSGALPGAPEHIDEVLGL